VLFAAGASAVVPFDAMLVIDSVKKPMYSDAFTAPQLHGPAIVCDVVRPILQP
jgi:hypothetical protein